MFRSILVAALIGIFARASARKTCHGGSAVYKVTFKNLLTTRRFGDSLPEAGIIFSPLTGVSHSNRQSFLTVRGFASKTVEDIAETGNNAPFITNARRLRQGGEGVLQVKAADGPTMPGRTAVLKIKVNCKHSFITVLGMIAPSPDWIVQINNENMVDPMTGEFIEKDSGKLIAYDAGTNDARAFTPSSGSSTDQTTASRKNIAPLVEDETDRFDGRAVGRYFIEKLH